MSKVQRINDNFSCVPDSQYKLVDEKTCECSAGTLYVMSEGCVGKAVGKNTKVVAMVDGASAVQKNTKAVVLGMTAGSIVTHLPQVTRTPVTTGSSSAAGAAERSVPQTCSVNIQRSR